MSTKDGDTIMFYHQGGVNVGDVDSKAACLEVPIGTYPTAQEIEKKLLVKLSAHRKAHVAGFIEALFKFYADLNFTYLEINPVVVTEDAVIPLDLPAKLDNRSVRKRREMGKNRVSSTVRSHLSQRKNFLLRN